MEKITIEERMNKTVIDKKVDEWYEAIEKSIAKTIPTKNQTVTHKQVCY